jgi:antitoxin component HigA of HigAB toxin-antitoxin module
MTIKPIKTERDRQKGLKDVEKLWDAKPVLNKKRNLSVEMKRALHQQLSIPAESLLGCAGKVKTRP